nr:hypothetical protein [Tanacetum cinerariifolium]
MNNSESAKENLLVPTSIGDSDSKVEVVFDETANLRISTSGKEGSDKGYGTNSLLKQWGDSYPDNDDYDPYDDDMYENHDMSEHLQSICDDLDITPPHHCDLSPRHPHRGSAATPQLTPPLYFRHHHPNTTSPPSSSAATTSAVVSKPPSPSTYTKTIR